jgi:hypothetical protein
MAGIFSRKDAKALRKAQTFLFLNHSLKVFFARFAALREMSFSLVPACPG